ncbi:MAG TPA: CusA/CzcA family heavy metal efflux RND transporter [Gemmataceae bacterium]|nr:CusA/CzcA family heavy metal efflux RND transporter [Gemmataceae bacterium]
MFDSLIRAALNHRALIVLLLVALIVSGVWSALHLPIDALPDISPTLVGVLTDAPSLGPEEVEQFITIPVENGVNGIPKIKEVRSVSQQGLSLVWLIFEDGTDIYWARGQVAQRLPQISAAIPPGFGQPEMGPIATGLGEIFQFEIKNAPDNPHPLSLMELRTILDWEVARPLKSVPGVIEVNSFGGDLKTYQAQIDPQRLMARNIPINKVFDVLRQNNSNAGGGYTENNGEVRIVRGEGLIRSLEDMDNVVLDTTPEGTPIYIRDVGRSVNAPMLRRGAVTRDGKGETATAIVYMLLGENARVVVGRIEKKLEQIRAKLRPKGVIVETYYNRRTLIDRAIHTVAHNLTEGAVLVILVLLLLLGNLRAGLIVAAAIPLSMLFAGNLMLYFGIAGSLMSLGAIDFGLIVDSSVIVMENCVSRLAHARPNRSVLKIVRDAVLEVRKPVVFGVAIITLVNLPILALEGVEGKMFRPMALTLIFALTGSLLLSLTATPVLASYFLRKGTHEKETFVIRWAKRIYEPLLKRILARPLLVAELALLTLALTVPIALRLGGEFIPRLDEGDLLVVMTGPPSASLSQGIEQNLRLERALRERFPDEVRAVICRTGRPEIGIDPAPFNQTDVLIYLTEYDTWTRVKDKAELIREVEKLCHELVPGHELNFSQPIENRFNEMISGVRADLGITLFGDDLNVLDKKSHAIASSLRKVAGAQDITVRPIKGLPYLRVIVDRERIARYGINAAQVLDAVQALGGVTVGQVVVNQRRFALQVRYAPAYCNDIDAIRKLKIADLKGRMIPLEDLANVRMEDGIYEINRQDRHRRAVVQANVRGRDLASFVSAAKRQVAADVSLPRDYDLEWGGTFKNLETATRRLAIVTPVALVLIFILLYGTFHSVRLGLLIFLSVPFAAIGGIVALYLRGLDFSISAGVGFICLSGVAVLDGLVLITAARNHVEEGMSVHDAAYQAAMSRLRPVLMTALVATFGFIPMALSTTAGAEVQRPLATVVIGGLVTSTLLNLAVVPAIYHWFDPGLPHHLEAEGVQSSAQLAEQNPSEPKA